MHLIVLTIPWAAFDPRQSIEQSGSTTIAGVSGVYAFDIMVTTLLKQLHQYSLYAFGFIYDGFCPNF